MMDFLKSFLLSKSYLYFVLIRQLQEEERVTYIRIREANNISIKCQSRLDDVTSLYFSGNKTSHYQIKTQSLHHRR